MADALLDLSAQLLQARKAYLKSREEWEAAQGLENQCLEAMNLAQAAYETARRTFNAALAEEMPNG